MIYLLFDIDGTLLLTGGAGRAAMMQVMEEMFGQRDLPRLPVHGRTDRAIIEDLFREMGLQLNDGVYREFTSRYHQRLPETMQAGRGYLLPGVTDVLEELAAIDQVACGLLTGNSDVAARIKTAHFGIDHHFRFGGYGGAHPQREMVAREALADCRRQLAPRTVEASRVWVVGDTIADVRCARAIEANVIAVTTGGDTREQLEQAGADLVMDDLSDSRPLLAICQTALS